MKIYRYLLLYFFSLSVILVVYASVEKKQYEENFYNEIVGYSYTVSYDVSKAFANNSLNELQSKLNTFLSMYGKFSDIYIVDKHCKLILDVQQKEHVHHDPSCQIVYINDLSPQELLLEAKVSTVFYDPLKKQQYKIIFELNTHLINQEKFYQIYLPLILLLIIFFLFVLIGVFIIKRYVTTPLEISNKALKESMSQLQSITDGSQDAILTMNSKGEITFWNPAAERIFGYKADEVLGKDLHQLLVPKRYLSAFEEGFKHFLLTGTGNAIGTQSELYAIHKDGYEFSIDLALDGIRIGHEWHAVGVLRDNTEKRAAEKIIQKQTALLEKAQAITKLGIFEHDLTIDHIKWSDEMYQIFEQDKEKFILTFENLMELIHPDDRELLQNTVDKAIQNKEEYEIEHRIRFQDGRIKWLSAQGQCEYDEQGQPTIMMGTVLDITEHKAVESRMREQTLTDELTQLGNRKAFNERFMELTAQYERYKVPFSMLILDIDHFKSVNDTYGHLVGDDVLVALSKEMVLHTRKTDYVYRYGGEEFVILLTGITLENAVVLAEKIRTSVQKNVNALGRREITISIGVAEFRKEDNYDSFVKRADDNLYRAKESGRNRVVA